jgi:hypothetical protein
MPQRERQPTAGRCDHGTKDDLRNLSRSACGVRARIREPGREGLQHAGTAAASATGRYRLGVGRGRRRCRCRRIPYECRRQSWRRRRHRSILHDDVLQVVRCPAVLPLQGGGSDSEGRHVRAAQRLRAQRLETSCRHASSRSVLLHEPGLRALARQGQAWGCMRGREVNRVRGLVAIAVALSAWACTIVLPQPPAPPPPDPPCAREGPAQVCCMACERMRQLSCDAFGSECFARCESGGWGSLVASCVSRSEIDRAFWRFNYGRLPCQGEH